jgi:hypothetical protein
MFDIKDGIYNAKILDVKICINEYDYVNVLIELSCENFSTSFGKHGLTELSNSKDTWKVGYTITRLMQVFEVNDFYNIKGSFARILIQDATVKGIGNIVKDNWFYPIKEIYQNKNYG